MTFIEVASTTGARANQPVVVDESVVVRRAALYRRGFTNIALSFPVALTRFGTVAEWMRRHKVCVTVTSAAELSFATAAGISAERMTMHSTRPDAPVRFAINAGIGRFVVSTSAQVATLAAFTDHAERLVVELSADTAALVPEILAHHHLKIIGAQYRIRDNTMDPFGINGVRVAIQEMARIRRTHGVLLTHVCLDGLNLGNWCEIPRVLRNVADALDEAAGAACEHHRYPRPVLSVTPDVSSLLFQSPPTAPHTK